MKPLLTILLLFTLSLSTSEQEVFEPDMFTVGRFVIYISQDGYRAMTGGVYSGLHMNVINAITEIS